MNVSNPTLDGGNVHHHEGFFFSGMGVHGSKPENASCQRRNAGKFQDMVEMRPVKLEDKNDIVHLLYLRNECNERCYDNNNRQ